MTVLIDVLKGDLRQTVREIRRSPGATLMIVAVLALGVGVNAAMFTVLDRILFRQPDGVRSADEVHRLYKVGRGFRTPISYSGSFSAPELDGVRYAAHGVARVAGMYTSSVELVAADRDTSHVAITGVTADYFELLGVMPQRGRFFAADELRYGDPRYVAVLSDALWRQRFGADSAIIGHTIRAAGYRDTTSYTIIGVATPGFSGVSVEADGFWIPFTARAGATEGPGAWWMQRGSPILSLITRIPAATDRRSVEARLTTALRRVNAGAGSWFDSNTRVVIAPLVEARGPRFSAASTRELTLATRMAVMSLVVLVLAIANVVGLTLMRSLARQREVAVRVALGISRGRIVSRLAVDGAVVTFLAGSAAVLLARWTGGVLRPLLFSTVQWSNPLVDRRVICLVLLMTALATIVSSIAPLVLAVRGDVMSLLKAGGFGAGSPVSRLRSTFLASHTAICVALLAAAGLFIQSLHRAVTFDLGYDPDRLLLVDASGYGNASPRAEFSALASQLASSPGVEVVSRTGIGGGHTVGVLKLQGRDSIPMNQAPQFNFVDGRWAKAMGLRLRAGHSFSDEDIASSAAVAMISRAMAEKFWPGQNALGQCLGTGWRDCYRVVGVFEDIRYDMAAAAEPYYVLPVLRTRAAQPQLLLRYSRSVRDDDVARIGAAVVASVGLAPASLRSVRAGAYIDRQLRPWRIAAALLSVFAIVGLASAGAAVFGLVSYDVGRRTREIGVRTALGGNASRVMKDVLQPSLRVIGVGVGVGIAVALLSGRVMASLLFETSASDPEVLLMTVGALGVVAGMAGLVPAIRATKINPVVALQAD
ncbi:MAG: ABC transporter permease [Gemmatimonadaceae bacterium]